ncbi:ARMT1-like domain-containing protein, partial [Candidatus Latescibacterota bacterium]
APGTILHDCSPSFRESFSKADLIIAKGQGNYESLNEERKNIVFLLMAKCPVIAHDTGSDVGSFVLKTSLLGNTVEMENV